MQSDPQSRFNLMKKSNYLTLYYSTFHEIIRKDLKKVIREVIF